MLYDQPNWINTSKVSMNIQTTFVENDIIIGYLEEMRDGSVKMKLRNPWHKIKIPKGTIATTKVDTRLLEKGMVCRTKHKPELIKLIKELGIKEVISSNKNVDYFCNDIIMKRLIDLEMKERKKDSKLKYFYMFYDTLPQFK
jgi:hypothetical protein